MGMTKKALGKGRPPPRGERLKTLLKALGLTAALAAGLRWISRGK